MKEMRPHRYTRNMNIFCDWTDEKNYLFQDGMQIFFVRHGKLGDKVPLIISLEQNKGLEKYKIFKTQKNSSNK